MLKVSCWTYFYICLLFSYTVFIVLLPITYWICVLKLKQTDRIVIFRYKYGTVHIYFFVVWDFSHERISSRPIVFRLGKLIGSRGPGRVLIFPWIDRVQQVDVSNSAFR
jgi:hypothetical protein